jgi:hypothetical protein
MACFRTDDPEAYPRWFLAHVAIATFLRSIPNTYDRLIDGEVGYVSWSTERQETFDSFVRLAQGEGLLIEQTSRDKFAASSPEETEGDERAQYSMHYVFGMTRNDPEDRTVFFVQYAKHFND